MFQEAEHVKKTIEEAKPDDISQVAKSKLSLCFTLEYSVEKETFNSSYGMKVVISTVY